MFIQSYIYISEHRGEHRKTGTVLLVSIKPFLSLDLGVTLISI